MNLLILTKVAFAFLISLLMTLYLVPLLISVAHKLGILDIPNNQLKNHKTPTPYLGGVGVYIGFIIALALVFPFANNLFLFLVGSTLLLFVGLVDDLIVMKPYQKFFGQIIAAFCFLKGGFYLKEAFLFASPQPLISFFWMFISFGWILTVINAFNLVDVMDGLAATLASSIAFVLLLVAFALSVPVIALLLAAFLGAVIGFLWFNKPTAKIYLGDAGSLFIGGFLATVPFMIPWGTYTTYGFLTPVIIFSIPLLEVGTLILVRTYKKIPFYNGSPDHFSIYLRQSGWSKTEILWYVALLNILLGLCAFLFALSYISLTTLIFLYSIFILCWFSVFWIKRH